MHDETRLIHEPAETGRGEFLSLTTPVHRASTVVFPTMAAFMARRERLYDGYVYGLYGTPTTDAFERRIAALEGGYRAIALPSGLAAIAVVNAALLSAGDHVLVSDSVYGPSREFCDTILERIGVNVTYYDPLIGPGIASLIGPRTRLIWTESPGSLTFEVQDIPAIAAEAHARGALVALDNTWATPLHFKPFAHGADISVQAASKYIVGHSDVVMGVVTARSSDLYRRLKDTARLFGIGAAPDDCYLALRGLETMATRLARHARSALEIARWLTQRPEVARVLHPALPDDPGHALWKRDFTGSNGLFSVVLQPYPPAAIAAMIDGLRLFKIGASWGGVHSLVAPSDPRPQRTARPWNDPGPLLRFHIGLEEVQDLVADLEHAFARLNAAASTQDDGTGPHLDSRRRPSMPMTFHVENIHCTSCARKISEAIAAAQPGAQINVDVKSGIVTVSAASDHAKIADAIRGAGYALRDAA
jgi:cystathionine beta-lyase